MNEYGKLCDGILRHHPEVERIALDYYGPHARAGGWRYYARAMPTTSYATEKAREHFAKNGRVPSVNEWSEAINEHARCQIDAAGANSPDDAVRNLSVRLHTRKAAIRQREASIAHAQTSGIVR